VPIGQRGVVVRQHRTFKHLSLLVRFDRFDGEEAARWVRAHDLRLLCVVERVAELEI
jgi:hypothetical protein